MKRRILLVATTVLFLAMAWFVYSRLAGRHTADAPPPEVSERRRPTDDLATRPGATVGDVVELEIIARDKAGRLEAVYRARKWDRRPDGSHVLIEPRVEMFHGNGQRTVLRADRGEVYGEQLDRGMNVRRAKLSGNVTIYFDPSRGADRRPVEEIPDEIVRVYVDEVEFDREHLTIETDRRVTVFSPQADIYGRGLTISWNESPRELRLLRVEQGEYMAVYEVPEELDVIGLPGDEDETAGTGSATAPAPAAADGGEPTGRTRPSTSPATKPGEGGAEEELKAKNQYVAEFQRDVRVIHRDRRLYGAETLALRFDWDTSWREAPGGYFGPDRQRRRRKVAPSASEADTAPGARPVETAPADAAAPPVPSFGRTMPPATRPATRPTSAPATAPATGPAEPEPMEIYWSGPLVIRPTGHTDTPTRDRYDLTARGPKVVLTDPRATAVCEEFVFHHPDRTGYLRGAGDAPARLLLAEGLDIASRRITFDPRQGQARFDGAGYMAQRFSDGLEQARAIELAETESGKTVPQTRRATWSEDVDVGFATVNEEGPEGTTRSRQVLRTARLNGDVELLQSADPNADFVRCDRLDVLMSSDPDRPGVPRRAIATGNVSARQQGSDLAAERAVVAFRQEPDEDEGPADADAGGRAERFGSLRAESVLAEGDVRLTDRGDANEPVLRATGQRMQSDLTRRTAVLSGEPATIERGTNRMVGRVIQLDQAEGSAVVDGKGTLRFLTRQDINGNELPEPRPVNIRWSRGMEFRGERRTAAFRGDVSLDSGMDEVRCREMQLLFADPPESEPAATQPAGKTDSRRLGGLGVGVERYSRRRISMILADGDVALRSRRETDANQLLRRLQLAGTKLIYDAESARMTMLGHGTFVAEDYAAPRENRPRDDDGLVAAVGRPSQSAFEWHRSMQLSQRERLVVLDGKVKMVHKSGRKIVLADRMNVPRERWGTLQEGRKTILACGNMMVKFGPGEEGGSESPPAAGADVLAAGGPDLGPIELFSASTDVNLRDGPRQVLAQRLIYNRMKDLAVIWGFLDGKPPANAMVVYEDPATGRSQSWSSPKIIWYRRNNRIITEEVVGAGGR